MSFAQKLETWYSENGRDLPWRNTKNPYYIWLSEIILQQTRIEQGRSYYEHFVQTYPTLTDLASASEEKVLKSWQGLGYYSRARNLHAAARQIMNEYGGEFPNSYLGIMSLKGVGRYTAAAIASFAFKLPYPVIDGNVYRLIARVFDISTPIGTDAAYKEFEALLKKLIDKENPDIFNQAIMDFGSTQCRPIDPDCENCIFQNECVAYQKGKARLLPVKGSPVKVRKRYFYYLHLSFPYGESCATLLQQRRGKDIWKGLYEFPLLERDHPLAPSSLDEEIKAFLSTFTSAKPASVIVEQPIKHILTHQHIEAAFIRLQFDHSIEVLDEKYRITPVEELKKVPISRLIDKYLAQCGYLFP